MIFSRRSTSPIRVHILALCLLTAAACASREYKFGELTRLADKYKTDKGTALHHYTEVYECFFYPIRSSARKICEIGILDGASLQMFAEYFPQALIYGIDIKDASHLNSTRIRTFVADQADREQLTAFSNTNGADFDFILDDGGHTMEQQQVSFARLFGSVKPGGYYIIEDVHTSLRTDYGAEPDESNTTLTMIHHFIRTGQIESRYMTAEERKYLTDNLSYCNLLSRNNGSSIACIFSKSGR